MTPEPLFSARRVTLSVLVVLTAFVLQVGHTALQGNFLETIFPGWWSENQGAIKGTMETSPAAPGTISAPDFTIAPEMPSDLSVRMSDTPALPAGEAAFPSDVPPPVAFPTGTPDMTMMPDSFSNAGTVPAYEQPVYAFPQESSTALPSETTSMPPDFAAMRFFNGDDAPSAQPQAAAQRQIYVWDGTTAITCPGALDPIATGMNGTFVFRADGGMEYACEPPSEMEGGSTGVTATADAADGGEQGGWLQDILRLFNITN